MGGAVEPLLDSESSSAPPPESTDGGVGDGRGVGIRVNSDGVDFQGIAAPVRMPACGCDVLWMKPTVTEQGGEAKGGAGRKPRMLSLRAQK
jgi:hypothetical protein